MNTKFQHLISEFALNGFLSPLDCRALRNVATDAELDPSTCDLLRLYGATESFAAQVITERSGAHLDMLARLQSVADGFVLPGDGAARLIAELRTARGDCPAAIARRLGCGRSWADVVRAVEVLASPRKRA